MKRLLLLPLLLLLACASLTPLQVAQQSHDYLALAQDTEAHLCWGVSNVAAAIAANVVPNHCTSPLAAAVGLTDARHQEFNGQMKLALDLHRSTTLLLASGAKNVNVDALTAAIQTLIAIVLRLTTTQPDVATLQLNLQKAVPR